MAVCARLVLSERQLAEGQPHFQRSGFRIPVQEVGYLQELEKRGKLCRPPRGSLQPLSDAERKCFRGRGHRNVTDDIHLYEAARSLGRLVVTEDSNLLRKAGDIYKSIGVETASPDDM